MPCKKRKRQKTKIEISEKLKLRKAIDSRLMVINLKIDDYVYKKKPISMEEADMYAREMEQFRQQCCDERHLQVIDKLISYMKCIIRDKSPIDITHSTIVPIENATQKLNDKNEYNMVDEVPISRFMNLSIVEPNDSLDISGIKTNTYQEKGKVENSTIIVTNEKLNEVINSKVCSLKINRMTPEIDRQQDITQKKTADGGSKHSKEILNNVEYENCTSSSKLRDYRITKNEDAVKTLQNTKITITNHGTADIQNSINISQSNNLNLKDINVESQVSPNLLSNFEYGNFIPLTINSKNVNFEPNNVTDTRNNDSSKINIITSLNEVSNTNTIKLKDEINTNKHVLSQKLSNLKYINTSAVCIPQNNTNLKNIQQSHIISVPNIIENIRKSATNSNNLNPGYTNTKLEISLNSMNEIGRECDKMTQNIPSNFEQLNYNFLQNNLQNPQIFKGPTFASPNLSQDQANGIEKVKNRRKYDKKNKIGTARNTVNAKNYSQNQTNGIEKVKKQRKTVKRDITKTRQMRECKQNSKEIAISKPSQIAVNFENSTTNSGQKNKRKLFNNKREVKDLTWVDDLRFLRVIEREEFTRVDNLDETFWSELTFPTNIINLKDFECDDNISIWK